MKEGRRQYNTMRFQNLHRRNFFEGWYYEHVSSDESCIVCLIPGVSVSGGKTSPFLQAILAEKNGDDWTQTTDWLDIAEFHAQDEPFALQLEQNHFRRDGISVDFTGDQIRVNGELQFFRRRPAARNPLVANGDGAIQLYPRNGVYSQCNQPEP